MRSASGAAASSLHQLCCMESDSDWLDDWEAAGRSKGSAKFFPLSSTTTQDIPELSPIRIGGSHRKGNAKQQEPAHGVEERGSIGTCEGCSLRFQAVAHAPPNSLMQRQSPRVEKAGTALLQTKSRTMYLKAESRLGVSKPSRKTDGCRGSQRSVAPGGVPTDVADGSPGLPQWRASRRSDSISSTFSSAATLASAGGESRSDLSRNSTMPFRGVCMHHLLAEEGKEDAAAHQTPRPKVGAALVAAAVAVADVARRSTGKLRPWRRASFASRSDEHLAKQELHERTCRALYGDGRLPRGVTLLPCRWDNQDSVDGDSTGFEDACSEDLDKPVTQSNEGSSCSFLSVESKASSVVVWGHAGGEQDSEEATPVHNGWQGEIVTSPTKSGYSSGRSGFAASDRESKRQCMIDREGCSLGSSSPSSLNLYSSRRKGDITLNSYLPTSSRGYSVGLRGRPLIPWEVDGGGGTTLNETTSPAELAERIADGLRTRHRGRRSNNAEWDRAYLPQRRLESELAVDTSKKRGRKMRDYDPSRQSGVTTSVMFDVYAAAQKERALSLLEIPSCTFVD